VLGPDGVISLFLADPAGGVYTATKIYLEASEGRRYAML
jgi:hypothetical protein